MAKGKEKIQRSDSSAPAQPRSLRSGKRGRPSEEISETDVQTAICHQDTRETNAAEDPTLLQCPLLESTSASTQHEAAEQPCPTKQNPVTEENPADPTDVTVTDFAEQNETAVTKPNNVSKLEGFTVHSDNDADKVEITAEECKRSPTQTGNDHLQVFVPLSEEGDGSFTTVLEERADGNENSNCNLERNAETSREEPTNAYTADMKITTKEAAAVLPAKKKRRMGTCGLTEKERSHFLQTHKRENGQKEPERVETQVDDNTADLVAQEGILSTHVLLSSISIPARSESQQNEAAIKLQSPNCEVYKRAEADVCVAVTTSDGSITVSGPGCSEEKSCGAEGGTEPDPEQTAEPKLDLPAEEEGEEEEEEPMNDVSDGSVLVDQSPAIASSLNQSQNEEAEDQGEFETACQEVTGVTMTTQDEKKEELTGDDGNTDRAPAGASSTASQAGGLNCGSVELREAAVTPGGSEKDDSCEPEDEPRVSPSTRDAELRLTRDTSDPFGPDGCLDYVSDSQLNTISLTEEELTEREDALAFPDFQEDASDLICGLIRELSSLNRKVMATHRELESFRRCTKS
ncbi:uncharacterized protein si:ch211-286b5.2 [Labrus bergylta]|uniref:uncharacterized protein si:ch211-286b5.2 n=1 Tax=Labrus bergylta TaxID=56723 RepID=UPI0033142755